MAIPLSHTGQLTYILTGINSQAPNPIAILFALTMLIIF